VLHDNVMRFIWGMTNQIVMACRCLEGLFDTWGTFGHGFNNNLTLGGPTPIGARKANLSDAVLPFMQEVALNEQVGCGFLQESSQ
jgi:hypothetical protein